MPESAESLAWEYECIVGRMMDRDNEREMLENGAEVRQWIREAIGMNCGTGVTGLQKRVCKWYFETLFEGDLLDKAVISWVDESGDYGQVFGDACHQSLERCIDEFKSLVFDHLRSER